MKERIKEKKENEGEMDGKGEIYTKNKQGRCKPNND